MLIGLRADMSKKKKNDKTYEMESWLLGFCLDTR